MENSNNSLSQGVECDTVNGDHDNDDVGNNENSTAQNRDSQSHGTQNLICFWMIGLCNLFGGTVMISATFDIIKGLSGATV